jgi:hypothetical protein
MLTTFINNLIPPHFFRKLYTKKPDNFLEKKSKCLFTVAK